MKREISLVILTLVVVSASLYGECFTQMGPNVDLEITIPADVGIHGISFVLSVPGSPVFTVNTEGEDTNAYDGFSDGDLPYDAFAVAVNGAATDTNTDGAADAGYSVEITSSGSQYTVLFRKKPVGTNGVVTGTDHVNTLHITGLSGTYSLPDPATVVHYDSSNTGFPPVDVASFNFSPCNQPFVATITPDFGGADGREAGNVIYMMNPALLTLNGSYSDTDDYSGDTTTVTYAWTGTPTASDQNQDAAFTTGQHDVALSVLDAHNVASPSVTKTISVLPTDVVTFPSARGLPYDSLKEPLIDGILSGPDSQQESDGATYGENGWRGAHMFTFTTGTTLDGSAMFLRSQDNQSLIFGFRIESDTTAWQDDVLVMGFRDDADDRLDDPQPPHDATLVYIAPTERGPDDYADLEADVQIYTLNSGSWVGGDADETALAGAGWNIGLQAETDDLGAETGVWGLEVRIPLSELALDSSNGQFLFFFDVFVSQPGGSTEPVRWPREMPDVPGDLGTPQTDIVDDRDLIDQFDPVWWGRATRADNLVANGLSLPSANNVGVQLNPGDTVLSRTIDWDGDNTFVAFVQNTSERLVPHDFDGAGPEAAVAAIETLPVSNVTVTFRIANWGIPPADEGYWIEIPAAGNPVTVPVIGADDSGPDGHFFRVDGPEVPDDQYTQEVSFVWNPSTSGAVFEQIHQCIHVELSSPNQADIVTRSVHRNMNFDALNDGPEAFSETAEISGVGYGRPPAGADAHRFLLRIFARPWEYTADEVETIKEDEKRTNTGDDAYFDETLPYILEADGEISFIEFVVKAYRFTGDSLVVRGEERERVVPVGSYGHVVRHYGPVEDWEYRIEGDGVERIDKNTYIITIEPETARTVNNVVKAIEPPHNRVLIGAGAAYPLAPLSAGYRLGFNAIVGYGYEIARRVTIIGLVGYNYLLPQSGTATGLHMLNVSVDGRWYSPLLPAVSGYVGGGAGVYYDSPATFDVGVNVGPGLAWHASPRLEIEAGVDYHYRFLGASQYVHAHAGMVLRF